VTPENLPYVFPESPRSNRKIQGMRLRQDRLGSELGEGCRE
jgi:hypothetical protein